MNKEKLISEFTEKMMEIYVDRDTYSRGKIIDMAKEAFAEVINKNCNIPFVIGSIHDLSIEHVKDPENDSPCELCRFKEEPADCFICEHCRNNNDPIEYYR